jgi:hypothetical protein
VGIVPKASELEVQKRRRGRERENQAQHSDNVPTILSRQPGRVQFAPVRFGNIHLIGADILRWEDYKRRRYGNVMCPRVRCFYRLSGLQRGFFRSRMGAFRPRRCHKRSIPVG